MLRVMAGDLRNSQQFFATLGICAVCRHCFRQFSVTQKRVARLPAAARPDKSDSPAVADNVAASAPPAPPARDSAGVVINGALLPLSVWLTLKICVLVAAFTSSVICPLTKSFIQCFSQYGQQLFTVDTFIFFTDSKAVLRDALGIDPALSAARNPFPAT